MVDYTGFGWSYCREDGCVFCIAGGCVWDIDSCGIWYIVDDSVCLGLPEL